MTLAEARAIINQPLEFGSKPDAKLYREATALLTAWYWYERIKERYPHSTEVAELLEKFPSLRNTE